MEAVTLKEKVHHLIDRIEDKNLLEDMYETLSQYEEMKMGRDILDDLTDEQKKQLYESIEQSERGEVKDWAVVKEEIKQWLTK